MCHGNNKDWNTVSVLGREEGYTVEYSLSPRDIRRAEPEGPVLLVAYVEVTAVSGKVDIAVAVESNASVEAVLATMLTCSQSNIRSHSH